MNSILFTLVSVVCTSLLSLIGILFFLVSEKSVQKTLLYFVSFSTGGLLGDVFIHIIPEISENADFFSTALIIILVGILFSFLVEKIIHWRHCHMLPKDCDHAENKAHHHHHHSVGLMSMMGESVHNFIDGVIIASSYMVSIPLGISTTLAIVFHEIPHEVGNFAVLLHSGFSRKKALMFNLLAASVSIVGAIVVLIFSQSFVSINEYLLPFAAGNLLYIAGSDLIPELHKETGFKQGIIQLLAMIGGMLVMYAILLFE